MGAFSLNNHYNNESNLNTPVPDEIVYAVQLLIIAHALNFIFTIVPDYFVNEVIEIWRPIRNVLLVFSISDAIFYYYAGFNAIRIMCINYNP
jgi:hypothetical protein